MFVTVLPEKLLLFTLILKFKLKLRPLRGDRRIPFGFRHVLLEAASVESSGV